MFIVCVTGALPGTTALTLARILSTHVPEDPRECDKSVVGTAAPSHS